MSKRPNHPERGRELNAAELKARMVVLIGPPDGALLSINVSSIDPMRHIVRFYSPAFGLVVEYRYDQHGVVYDDRGNPVEVYEYLGEI